MHLSTPISTPVSTQGTVEPCDWVAFQWRFVAGLHLGTGRPQGVRLGRHHLRPEGGELGVDFPSLGKLRTRKLLEWVEYLRRHLMMSFIWRNDDAAMDVASSPSSTATTSLL